MAAGAARHGARKPARGIANPLQALGVAGGGLVAVTRSPSWSVARRTEPADQSAAPRAARARDAGRGWPTPAARRCPRRPRAAVPRHDLLTAPPDGPPHRPHRARHGAPVAPTATPTPTPTPARPSRAAPPATTAAPRPHRDAHPDALGARSRHRPRSPRRLPTPDTPRRPPDPDHGPPPVSPTRTPPSPAAAAPHAPAPTGPEPDPRGESVLGADVGRHTGNDPGRCSGSGGHN